MTAPRELTEKRAADIAVYALIKVACQEAELILEVLEGLRFERDKNVCDACAGTGTPTSGPDCMCGGSGRMSDASHYLRERYAAEKVRADGLETRLTDMEEQINLAEIDRKSAKTAYDQLQGALDKRDDLQKRLDKAVDILNARHLGAGAVVANEKTREAALEFIRVELEARGR